MSTKLPESIEKFEDSYPAVWDAFMRLGDQCHKAGPLDEKTRRLVKIALAIGAGLEGGAHSAVRNAKAAGVTVDEMRHVAVPEHHYAGIACSYARPFLDRRRYQTAVIGTAISFLRLSN